MESQKGMRLQDWCFVELPCYLDYLDCCWVAEFSKARANKLVSIIRMFLNEIVERILDLPQRPQRFFAKIAKLGFKNWGLGCLYSIFSTLFFLSPGSRSIFFFAIFASLYFANLAVKSNEVKF